MDKDRPPLHAAAMDEALKQRLASEGVVFAEAPHALKDYAIVGAILNSGGDLFREDE